MKKNLRIDRLAKREERNTIKKIFYLTIVSAILAIILFTTGIQILGRFADFLEIIFPGKSSQQTDGSLQPSPPQLDRLPIATNSATLKVSGFSAGAASVDIYLNDQQIAEAEVNSEKFLFDNLPLKRGENTISAKAKSQSGKLSDFSQTLTILLDIDKPLLEIEAPNDGQTFSGDNRIKVSGTTEGTAQVYANGFLANVDSEGKFDVFVPVVEGETTIEVKSVDEAGNTTSQMRKINYKK